MPRHAISASRCATMAWPRGGWWYGHMPPLSGLRPVSIKHVSVKRRPSKNNSFTCKRSGLRPQARRNRRCQSWPTNGAITRCSPMRRELARQNETIPNQIHQPTNRPTLRWVFQVLEGIERVRLMVEGQVRDLITGLNEVKIKILRLFGEQVCHVYQLPSG